MRRALVAGSSGGYPEVDAFLDEADAAALFDAARPIVVTRAPGRLDLMGGIADYSGSLVTQWPLREATLAALQIVDDGRIHVVSRAVDGASERTFETGVASLFPDGRPLALDAARAWFRADAGRAWAAYAVGALLVLAHRHRVPPTGFRLLVRSSVPEGKGVSSSAALEVASLQALAAALGVMLDGRELALIGQEVENRIVGAACGVMDQMTSACGRAGELLVLLCQPAEIQGTIALPDDLEIWGLDSGERHTVAGADYTSVRVGAFMGARILAEHAASSARRLDGFLANLTPSELAHDFGDVLPEAIAGAAFLERYGGTGDPVTRVDPARTYPIRAPAVHPIHEHFRVRAFASLLSAAASERRAALLGELMFQSHASYGACGLGSTGTDTLVRLVREAGPERGLYGAKITGGGGGGTVAVLGRRGADLGPIVDRYAARIGRRPHVFSGSSPGAAAFGVLRLAPR